MGKRTKKEKKTNFFVGVNKPLPKEFSLLDRLPPIWHEQGDINSCVGESLAFVLSYHLYVQKKEVKKFSSLYIYWHARYLKRLHLRDDGAYLLDGAIAVKRWKACSFDRFPLKHHLLFTQPPPEAYEEAYSLNFQAEHYVVHGLENLKQAVFAGFPLVIGFFMPSSFHKARTLKGEIVIDLPSPHERVAGGHAVVVIGYSDFKEGFLCRNSWGRSWGDEGNFWLKYSFFTNSGFLASDAILVAVKFP